MPIDLHRRSFITGAAALAAPWPAHALSDQLTIGSRHGTIDFAIGDSRVFRTSGGFKKWQGKVRVDDSDVPKSSVQVIVDTKSVEMLDPQQTAMLRDADFFDVDQFPQMLFKSTMIDRTGDTNLKVIGDLTLRGITRPMTIGLPFSACAAPPRHNADATTHRNFQARVPVLIALLPVPPPRPPRSAIMMQFPRNQR